MSIIIIRHRLLAPARKRAFYSDEKAYKLLFIMPIKIILFFPRRSFVSLGRFCVFDGGAARTIKIPAQGNIDAR